MGVLTKQHPFEDNPARLQVSILTAGWIDRGMVADAARNGLTSAVSLVPFVALVILRSGEPPNMQKTLPAQNCSRFSTISSIRMLP